jgi:MerR family transcriptional regulator, thiopeptide resistance regulator
MPREALTVGDVARRTGLSVRTLHHYDALGLLQASGRTDAGYRLYTVRDLMKLQQIVLLKSLGLSLAQIARTLSSDGPTLLRTIETHVSKLRTRIEQERRVCTRLEETAARLRKRRTPTIEEIVRTIEEVTMSEKYFTPEQVEWMRERRAVVGETRIREVEAEWPRLVAEVRAAMEKGTPPSDPPSARSRHDGMVSSRSSPTATWESPRRSRRSTKKSPPYGRRRASTRP